MYVWYLPSQCSCLLVPTMGPVYNTQKDDEEEDGPPSHRLFQILPPEGFVCLRVKQPSPPRPVTTITTSTSSDQQQQQQQLDVWNNSHDSNSDLQQQQQLTAQHVCQ